MTQFRVLDDILYYNNKPLKTAELHLHLDGALNVEDVLVIAKRHKREIQFPENDINGNPLSYRGSREIKTGKQLTELWQGWSKYTIPDMFAPATSLMQTKDEIKEIAQAHVLKQAREGKLYFETRFAPQYHTREGLDMDQVIGYFIEGLNLGAEKAQEENLKTIPRLIIAIGREAEPDVGVKVAEAALQFQDCGVVALDLACYEPPFPPERHKAAFELTFDSKLKRTVHAGEMCWLKENLRNIKTSIHDLRADGLGQAKDLYLSKDLTEQVIARGIRIESNEISNVTLKFSHKVGDACLDKLSDCGVLVTVNSDDPSMWPDGSLAHCLLKAAQAYGDDFVKKVIANPIRGAFGLDEQDKNSLIASLENQFLTKL